MRNENHDYTNYKTLGGQTNFISIIIYYNLNKHYIVTNYDEYNIIMYFH